MDNALNYAAAPRSANNSQNRRGLNRVFGFLCGAPMLSSFSHYKYEHLRHHAFLGTPQNREFFNYRFRNLDSWWGFALGCFHLGRYWDVARDIGRSLVGRPIPRVARRQFSRNVKSNNSNSCAVVASYSGSLISTPRTQCPCCFRCDTK